MKLYQLKPEFAEDEHYCAMFFVAKVDPANYLRAWDGDIGSDDPEKIYGRFHLNPPENFHGRPPAPGDVLELDGQFQFISQEADGLELWEIQFDAAGIKPAPFVRYGYGIEAGDSNAMPVRYAEEAKQLGIPIGINEQPDYHGRHKGEPRFGAVPSDCRDSPVYLHPQFLTGLQAREYISAFTALCDRDNWDEIRDALKPRIPLCFEDMLAAKAQYALYDHRHCEMNDGDYTGKVLAIRDSWLDESCRTSENQLFYSQAGRGCAPTAAEGAVFGQFLIDGEKARLERGDFIGIVAERYLPDWAREKLAEMCPAAAPEEAPGQTM